MLNIVHRSGRHSDNSDAEASAFHFVFVKCCSEKAHQGKDMYLCQSQVVLVWMYFNHDHGPYFGA